MATIYHDAETEGSVHIPNNWTYASYSALIADTAFDSVDIGKIAWVEQEKVLFRLAQTTPTIKWDQVGGPSESFADSIIYVDASTGNDTTGDGSASYPYASFTFLDRLPKLIKHKITVRVANGTYTYFPALLDLAFSGAGQLTIEGVGAYTQVTTSIFTCTVTLHSGTFQSLVTIGKSGAAWTNDQYWGNFARFLSGAYAGRIVPIHKNTTSGFTTIPISFSPVSGNTFDVIRPSVIIEVDHTITIRQNGKLSKGTTGFTDTELARLGFLGIHLKITDNATGSSKLLLQNLNCVFSFSIIEAEEIPLELIDVELNTSLLDTTDLVNPVLGIGNDYPFIVKDGAALYPGFRSAILLKGTNYLAYISCRGGFDSLFSSSTLGFVAARGLGSLGSNITILKSIFEMDTFSEYLVTLNNSDLDATGLYIFNSTSSGIYSLRSSASFSFLEGKTVSQYAIVVDWLSHITAYTASAPLSGTTGQIWFDTTSAADTWPSVGSAKTDGLGSFVVGAQ